MTRTSVMPVSSLLRSMGFVAVTGRSLVGFVTVTRRLLRSIASASLQRALSLPLAAA